MSRAKEHLRYTLETTPRGWRLTRRDRWGQRVVVKEFDASEGEALVPALAREAVEDDVDGLLRGEGRRRILQEIHTSPAGPYIVFRVFIYKEVKK